MVRHPSPDIAVATPRTTQTVCLIGIAKFQEMGQRIEYQEELGGILKVTQRCCDVSWYHIPKRSQSDTRAVGNIVLCRVEKEPRGFRDHRISFLACSLTGIDQ